MDKIINKNNIRKYKQQLKSNYQDSIKTSILEIVETAYEELLENNNFTEEMLDDMAYNIRNDDNFNNYLDSLIEYEIEECIKINDLEEIEEEQ